MRGPKSIFWPVKYALEWGIALIACVILLPLFVVIAILVKITSPGPVFYLAERMGRNGDTFRMYKFRSMKVGVEKIVTSDNKVIVEDKDPRLTPIGSLLRKGFDELPQLLNVLRGEMAIIGPRPDEPFMLPEYIGPLKLRLTVLPGITGLSQVLDARVLPNEYGFDLDLYYIEHYTPCLDAHIALYTPFYAFGCRGYSQRWLRRIMPKAADAWERIQTETTGCCE